MSSKNNGYTPQTIRNRNYQVILNMLRESETCSIRELVLHSTLSKTAVKRILDNLMEAGMVEIAGKGQASEAGGKRPELYTLCGNQAYAISCLFGDSGYYVALFDLKLNKLHSSNKLGYYHQMPYQQMLHELSSEVLQLLERYPEIKEKLAFIAFSCPGIISYSEGILINPIQSPHWGKNIPFLSDMRSLLTLSCPFYFDNALRFGSFYDQITDSSLQNGSILIINYAQDSIGGSVLRERNLVHGCSGLSGEFGHIVTDYSFSETCSCGKTGCIESVAAHSRVVARAERELYNWPTSILNGQKLTFSAISNAADAGDVFAKRQMDFLIQQFTMLIYNLQIAIDPDLLILKCYTDSAPMRYFTSRVIDAVNRLSLSNSPVPIRIDVNQYASDTVSVYYNIILGGAMYGFDQLFHNEVSFNEFVAEHISAKNADKAQRTELLQKPD